MFARCTRHLPGLLVAAAAVCCGPGAAVLVGDGGPADGALACAGPDTDGDGIADTVEGWGDTDRDGMPSAEDTDSDGDGINDSEEVRSASPCRPRDSDRDGVPDYLDKDSDNDGLWDAEESGLGTDPTNADSDRDGVSDLAEVRGTGTDPLDPASTIGPGDFVVALPYGGEHEERTLRFTTDIQLADVFFLVDTTGSMDQERENLISGLLDTIIPGIVAEVPDVQLGAGGFDDYPLSPYGSAGTDLPFYLLRRMGSADEDLGEWSIEASASSCPSAPEVNDVGAISGGPNGTPDILEAVAGLPCHYGRDLPESHVPALWALATGQGLAWPFLPPYIGDIPAASCDGSAEDGAVRGYACFRAGALPVVLLFGDDRFHNSPLGADEYSFAAPAYGDTVAALRAIGARVIGVFSPEGERQGRGDYEAVARDTGAVAADGSPLVFDIGSDGSGLTSAVVAGVTALARDTPQDVTTSTENMAGNPGEVDATRFIKSITPDEGYLHATPGVGYVGKDGIAFYGVTPGIVVDFRVELANDVVEPATAAQVYRVIVVVLGNGVARLDERIVYIIVPPRGGMVVI